MSEVSKPRGKNVHPLRDALLAGVVTFVTSAVGLSIVYLKDPTSPRWHDDAAVKLYRSIMARYANLGALVARIGGLEPDPAEVRVVIETRHGLLVEALVDAGYTVLPVNPDLPTPHRCGLRPREARL